MRIDVITKWLAILFLTHACVLSPSIAAPSDFPSTMDVAGRRLGLNGVGVRYKAIFKVYEAGLYVTSPVHSMDEFVALDGPKRLHLVASRDINASELGRMLVRGVADANPRDQVTRQLVGIAQVGELFASRQDIRRGESFGFEYIPGDGTRLLINGKAIGKAVQDAEFFTVVMRIWLGPAALDPRLKAALLGLPEVVASATTPQ